MAAPDKVVVKRHQVQERVVAGTEVEAAVRMVAGIPAGVERTMMAVVDFGRIQLVALHMLRVGSPALVADCMFGEKQR